MSSSSDTLDYASSVFPVNEAPKDVAHSSSLQILARAYRSKLRRIESIWSFLSSKHGSFGTLVAFLLSWFCCLSPQNRINSNSCSVALWVSSLARSSAALARSSASRCRYLSSRAMSCCSLMNPTASCPCIPYFAAIRGICWRSAIFQRLTGHCTWPKFKMNLFSNPSWITQFAVTC